MNDTRRTKTFIGGMILAAVSTAGYAGTVSHSPHARLALAVLALAVATSRLKLKLPGINGNMSMNLPFLLTAVVSLSAAEAIAIAFISTAVQCWPRKNAKINLQQIIFNLSMMMMASASASLIVHGVWFHGSLLQAMTMRLVLATTSLFLAQTLPVAGIVAVSEAKSMGTIWWGLAHLSFPYYVISAGLSSMVQATSSHLGWGLALGVFPVMYGIHRSFRMYFVHLSQPLPAPVSVKAAAAGAGR
jgi:hypothetical protein